MLLPEEVEAKATIPALRAMVAKRLLHKYGLTQQRTAKLLGVTQAAISNYMRETRGAAYTLESNVTVAVMMDDLAKSLYEGVDTITTLIKFHDASQYIKGNRFMCDLHQKLEPGLEVEKCHICDAPTN
ncbi:MAG: helix-turn-helix domain-containing protein [Thaumarchaeota archaeon]|nr:helix-turn-helix domain-containing protein [Nitrososphaerota archaeon]